MIPRPIDWPLVGIVAIPFIACFALGVAVGVML